MKIEVGRFYKTRDGMKVKIYSTEDNDPDYPIHGAILWNDGWVAETWDKNGFYFWQERECWADIVSEWEE